MCIRDRDYSILGEQLKQLDEAGAQYAVSYTHLDVYKRQALLKAPE